MKILGNPVLGKIFRYNGLILTDFGLYKKVVVNNFHTKFLLTKDVQLIVSLLKLDYELINGVDNYIAFPHLVSSPHFDHSKYTKEETQSTALIEFSNWFNKPENNHTNTYVPLRTVEVESILGIELREKIDNAKMVMTEYNNHKFKFDGSVFIKNIEGYDKTNLNTHIPNFKKSFETTFDFQKFIVESKISEIIEKFKTINQI